MPRKKQTEIEVKPKRKYTKRKKKEPKVIEISDSNSELSAVKKEPKVIEISDSNSELSVVKKEKEFVEEYSSIIKEIVVEPPPVVVEVVVENKIETSIVEEKFPIPKEVGEIRKTMKLSQFCVCLSYNENSERMTVKSIGTRERCNKKMEKYKLKNNDDIYFVLKCDEFVSFC